MIYTRDNPKFITKPEEINELKRRDSFKSMCKQCGKEYIIHDFRPYRLNKYKLFLCQKCLTQYTFMKNYGCSHPMKSAKIVKKIAKIFENKYGVSNPSKLESIKLKKIKTLQHNFGVDNPSKSKDIQIRKSITKLNNFGDPNYNNRDKAKNTVLKKYGIENYALTREYKERMKILREKYMDSWTQLSVQKNIQNHNGVHYFNTLEYKQMMHHLRESKFDLFQSKRFIYNNIYLDSIPEFCVYLYCIYHWIPIIRNYDIGYEYKDSKNITHITHPDFIINGLLIEIKGKHFYNPDGTWKFPYNKKKVDGVWIPMTDEEYNYMCDLYECKRQCLINNGVLILKDTDPWVQNCITWVKNIININLFLKSNPNNLFYGYTPYNYNKNKMYQESIGIGKTPFDVKS